MIPMKLYQIDKVDIKSGYDLMIIPKDIWNVIVIVFKEKS